MSIERRCGTTEPPGCAFRCSCKLSIIGVMHKELLRMSDKLGNKRQLIGITKVRRSEVGTTKRQRSERGKWTHGDDDKDVQGKWERGMVFRD